MMNCSDWSMEGCVPNIEEETEAAARDTEAPGKCVGEHVGTYCTTKTNFNIFWQPALKGYPMNPQPLQV